MSMLGKLVNDPRLSVWSIPWRPLRAIALVVSIVLVLPIYLAVLMVGHLGAAFWHVAASMPEAIGGWPEMDDMTIAEGVLLSLIVIVIVPLYVIAFLVVLGPYIGLHNGIGACVRHVRSLPWRVIGEALLLREVRL